MANAYVRKRATPEVIGTERRPISAVPKYPAHYDRAHRGVWRELWRTPVAATWTYSDERLVMALVALHVALDRGEAAVEKVAGQIANLSTQLGLTPKSRIVLSIETRAVPVADIEAGRGAFTLNEVG